MDSPELAIVGRIRKAHGIRGEVVVEPITDAPDVAFSPARPTATAPATGPSCPSWRPVPSRAGC